MDEADASVTVGELLSDEQPDVTAETVVANDRIDPNEPIQRWLQRGTFWMRDLKVLAPLYRLGVGFVRDLLDDVIYFEDLIEEGLEERKAVLLLQRLGISRRRGWILLMLGREMELFLRSLRVLRLSFPTWLKDNPDTMARLQFDKFRLR